MSENDTADDDADVLFTTEFDHDEDTKNTRRYEEDPETAPHVGKLYVQKWTDGIEDADRVRVTVERVHDE